MSRPLNHLEMTFFPEAEEIWIKIHFSTYDNHTPVSPALFGKEAVIS